jgi:hypothetical protein
MLLHTKNLQDLPPFKELTQDVIDYHLPPNYSQEDLNYFNKLFETSLVQEIRREFKEPIDTITKNLKKLHWKPDLNCSIGVNVYNGSLRYLSDIQLGLNKPPRIDPIFN